jgi:hypothetical protein
MDDLIGVWDMTHDDWRGTVKMNPSDQHHIAIDGSCTYSTWAIDGTWTSSDGASHDLRGSFQGKDSNRRAGEACPASDHLVKFTIDFKNGDPPQSFEGYIFTHQKRTMAGYTWWHGIPFGWLATKR